MKKLILVISFISFISCSSEENDANEEICCDRTISQLRESYTNANNQVQNDPNATEQQKLDAEAFYNKALENPCEHYKKYTLEPAGASCDNP